MKKITFLLLSVFGLSAGQAEAQFSESFDSGIPATWSVVNQDAGTYTWEAFNNFTHSGAGNVRIHWEAAAHNDWLISPQFTVTPGVSDQASFWTGINTDFWTETFEVRLSTTGATPASFTVLLGSHTATSDATIGDFQQWMYNLSAYAGQSVRIAIRATDTDRFYLYVDDFVVNALPNCPQPAGLTASMLTATSVQLGWTPGGDETSWDVEIVETGNTPTGTPTASDVTNPYTATVTADTEYEFYVRANCSDTESSAWAGPFEFVSVVPPGCVSGPMPADAATNVPYGPITLSWTAAATGGTVESYDLYVGNTPTDLTYLTSYTTTTTADDLTIEAYGVTLYWQIVPTNAGGSPTGCPVWSFTTEDSPGYCLNGDVYPAATYTPETCDGVTENVITEAGWAGEYSNVQVTSGQPYTFWSSVATDFITISTDDGATAAVYGTSPLSWTSTVTGVVRFYTHTSVQCGFEDVNRTRSVVCGTPTADAPDYVGLQWPPTQTIEEGSTFTVYGRVYEPGLTEAAGAGAGIQAWVGVNSANTNPNTWSNWTPMTFNVQAGNDDEYMGTLGGGLTVGTYYYAVRFRLNDGGYVYGGTDGSNGNFWNGTSHISGVLTVTPASVPANDLCGGALPLTVGATFDANDVTGTLSGATTTTGLTFTCQNNRDMDVWYSAVVPASGSLTVETAATPGSGLTDTVLSVFTGACGTLTEIGCNDDNTEGTFSTVELSGLVPGSTVYIGVWRWINVENTAGQFQVSAYDANLAVDGVNAGQFEYYPNPVRDVLNISHTGTILNAEVFNLLGQQLLVRKIDANQAQLDLSGLSKGTYLVKLNSEAGTKTIKVLKQ